jgi:hypothetical protein
MMEAIAASLGLVLSAGAVLFALGMVSIRWGADSRPPIADDHRR